jgi:thiamine pyrophosphokinase
MIQPTSGIPLEVFVLQAIVFANGTLKPPPQLDRLLASAKLLIAADGGARHCRTLGVRPHVILGDFDSLSASERAAWEAEGIRTIAHPIEKDATDLELALLYAQENGADEVVVLGGLGTRWDHSIANLLLGAHSQFAGMHIALLQGQERMFIVRGHAALDVRLGEIVSLLPVGGDATGITTRGLKYPLADETLRLGSSRGVSNVVAQEGAEVQLNDGLLLCIISPPEVGGNS